MSAAPLDDGAMPAVHFRRSSFCAAGSCVEVAALPGDEIALRDSKDDNSPLLRFTPEEWDAFVAGVLDGQFSRDALRTHSEA
ncbi:DUF397 domain-containing protein [Pseudonocardia endophytica]|uniref:Uncharacterized protein DUF397 n=1 Tax=Pseudonocardia endophytica TaxID=401976 RepID=A0A4R1HIQ0_PSEEN|nr:DUF397 domain-containing protein [Pseudonocardia endophytica]TCK20753.1 uncharacterized protein DUF397 [Pseudonocardia endophytica]